MDERRDGRYTAEHLDPRDAAYHTGRESYSEPKYIAEQAPREKAKAGGSDARYADPQAETQGPDNGQAENSGKKKTNPTR